MSHVFFATELEGVATFWRILRRDGAALGFTSHDRDLAFGGMTYRSAPGMVPSAIRRTASLERDTMEIEGVLAHDAISDTDLEEGRFAGARIAVGLVDWETLDRAVLFNGTLGDVAREDGGFTAELRSAKADLEIDLVPRTSPTCRAVFCDASCGVDPMRHSHMVAVSSVDLDGNEVVFTGAPPASEILHGSLRWIDGPHAGITMQVIDASGTGVVLDRPLSATLAPGDRARLREGCDHTIATCAARFDNARNFRGEPHLPGNDLLARYPNSAS